MDNLIDTRTIKRDTFIVRIAEVCESIRVIATTIRLQDYITPRALECPGHVPERFIVALLLIVDLEWRFPVQNQIRGNTSVTGAEERLDWGEIFIHIISSNKPTITTHECASIRYQRLDVALQLLDRSPD